MEKTEGLNTLVKLIGVLSSSFESFHEEQRRQLADIRLELGGVRTELDGLKADFAGLRAEFKELRSDVNRDIGRLRLEIAHGLERQERLSLSILEVLGTSLEDLDTRVSKLEAAAVG